jgi:hypothetical protein
MHTVIRAVNMVGSSSSHCAVAAGGEWLVAVHGLCAQVRAVSKLVCTAVAVVATGFKAN